MWQTVSVRRPKPTPQTFPQTSDAERRGQLVRAYHLAEKLARQAASAAGWVTPQAKQLALQAVHTRIILLKEFGDELHDPRSPHIQALVTLRRDFGLTNSEMDPEGVLPPGTLW